MIRTTMNNNVKFNNVNFNMYHEITSVSLRS